MPSIRVRRGIYWSNRTKTWHYEFRLQLLPGERSQKYNGDTGHTLESDARTWLTAYRARLKDQAVGLQAAGPAITLDELVRLYVAKRGSAAGGEGAVSDHTLQVAQLRARLHWTPLMGLPLTQITTAAVEDMRQAYLNGEGRRSKGGANKVVATLVTVLQWAIRRGLLKEVPFILSKLRFQKKVKVIVWPEQQRPFLRASRRCRNADARLGLMACLTMGFRESEALGLRWEWFDWVAQVYRVGKAKDMDPRSIPMHPVFRRVMRTRWLARGKPSMGLVLGTEAREAHVAGYLRKPTQTAARALGIVGLHPHSLRASFATAQWEAGASIAQLQGWLGHEDPSTTMLYVVKRDLDGRQIQRRAAALAGWPEPQPKPQAKKPRAIPQRSPSSQKSLSKRRKKAA